jgi:hypothetical protein
MKLLEQLKKGKKLKVKHPEYQFTINANLKLQNYALLVEGLKISLPQKANKGEKLLLKLVQIYCYDVLQNNLTSDVYASKEFIRLQNRVENEIRNSLDEK